MIEGEATLRWALEPIASHLEHDATTEIVFIEPRRCGVEQDGFWSWHELPEMDRDRLEAIAILSARNAGKRISKAHPSCRAKLPGGQRIKVIVPPAVPDGTVSLCIRKRAQSFTPTLEWLSEHDYFDMLDPAVDWPQYFRERVIAKRRTPILSGGIGESKTTCAEAILRAIPLTQRLVTVEASSEWSDLPHPNWQPLFYDETIPGDATRRIQDAMQERPDWLPFQEVGGSEAWALLRALKIGVPGITTVHAPSALEALDSLESMIKQSESGREMDGTEIRKQLRQYIGVIAHCARFLPEREGRRTRYRMTEVVEIGRTEAEDTIVSCSAR